MGHMEYEVINKRRYELDWLRVIAFGVLIYFHAAIFFVPFGQPLIQNEETSTMLEHFIHVSSQFRLALLFFISGVGVYFARRKLNERAFVEERSRRLLIPLGVGLLFVVPPMVYIEKVFLSKFEGSLLDFYPLVFTTGVYPEGNLSWHHFWFIAYLYLFACSPSLHSGGSLIWMNPDEIGSCHASKVSVCTG